MWARRGSAMEKGRTTRPSSAAREGNLGRSRRVGSLTNKHLGIHPIQSDRKML